MSQIRVERGWVGIAAATSFVLLSATAFYTIQIYPSRYDFDVRFKSVVDNKNYPEKPEIRIQERYTGIAGFDYGVRFLVTAFLPGVAGFSKEEFILSAYFLISFFPMIAIYSVEAGRHGSRRALTWYTSIWALFYQTAVGAVIIPLYHLTFLWESSKPGYYSAPTKRLSVPYAKALLPALIIGYLIPTIAMYAPWSSDGSLTTQQYLAAFWQFTPLVVNILLFLLPPLLRSSADQDSGAISASISTPDQPYVEMTYALSFAVSCLGNLALLYTCLFGAGPKISLTRLFIPDIRAASREALVSRVLFSIFKIDFDIIFASSLIWAAVAVYDIKAMGKMGETSLLRFILLTVLGFCVAGPAAVVVGIWWWRERLIRAGEIVKRD